MIKLRVGELLEKKQKSVYWLAKQTGMSNNNMTKICKGETSNIRLETMEKLCKALECTPNDLIISDDPKMMRLINHK